MGNFFPLFNAGKENTYKNKYFRNIMIANDHFYQFKN